MCEDRSVFPIAHSYHPSCPSCQLQTPEKDKRRYENRERIQRAYDVDYRLMRLEEQVEHLLTMLVSLQNKLDRS